MRILALEFSSPVRTVAVAQRQGASAVCQVLGRSSDEGDRAVTPLPLIERALAEAGVARRHIEEIRVGLGPGSYTGVRSSIALAQGWQLVTGVQVAGVSSMECLAQQAQAKGWLGHVCFAIDAQRHEVYLADYDIQPDGWRALQPLRLAPVAALEELSRQPQLTLAGPEISRWAQGKVLFPDAGDVACRDELAVAGMGGEQLQPIYLRETTFVKASGQSRKGPNS